MQNFTTWAPEYLDLYISNNLQCPLLISLFMSDISFHILNILSFFSPKRSTTIGTQISFISISLYVIQGTELYQITMTSLILYLLCTYVYSSIHLSVCLPVQVCICLSVSVSVYLNLSVFCVSVSLSVCLFAPFLHLLTFPLQNLPSCCWEGWREKVELAEIFDASNFNTCSWTWSSFCTWQSAEETQIWKGLVRTDIDTLHQGCKVI